MSLRMKSNSRRSPMDSSSSTLSENFYNIFSELSNETEESLVSLLEEKEIKLSEKNSIKNSKIDEKNDAKDEDNHSYTNGYHRRPKTLSVDRQSTENRRSFNRKKRYEKEKEFKENSSNVDDSEFTFIPTFEYFEQLHSPAPGKRRSCSIATTVAVKPMTEIPNFLYPERLPRSVLPRSNSRRTAIVTPPQRSRTCSMPAVPRSKPMLGQFRKNEEPTDDFYRLRSFSITANGICKLGDCLRSKRCKSSCSVDSTSSITSSNHGRQQLLTSNNSDDLSSDVPVFNIAMLGASNVGKTTLSYQFTTSEYICAYDTSLDEECGQKTVCISLNGKEAEFNIIDIPASEMSVETFCYTYNIDVFVVVYSVIDSESFKKAKDILLYLWNNEYMTSKGVILVGNKADLERRRVIPATTGRKLALTWKCKFIETSSGLDHNVDELLVGIFAQVQLNPKRNRTPAHKRCPGAMENGKQLIKQLLKFGRKTKSCENLFVL